MSTAELFTSIAWYGSLYQGLFYVVVVWLVALGCLDLVVKLLRGSWR